MFGNIRHRMPTAFELPQFAYLILMPFLSNQGTKISRSKMKAATSIMELHEV